MQFEKLAVAETVQVSGDLMISLIVSTSAALLIILACVIVAGFVTLKKERSDRREKEDDVAVEKWYLEEVLKNHAKEKRNKMLGEAVKEQIAFAKQASKKLEKAKK